jgi:hypothetical protein
VYGEPGSQGRRGGRGQRVGLLCLAAVLHGAEEQRVKASRARQQLGIGVVVLAIALADELELARVDGD